MIMIGLLKFYEFSASLEHKRGCFMGREKFDDGLLQARLACLFIARDLSVRACVSRKIYSSNGLLGLSGRGWLGLQRPKGVIVRTDALFTYYFLVIIRVLDFLICTSLLNSISHFVSFPFPLISPVFCLPLEQHT